MAKAWSPSSWQAFPVKQQPQWPELGELDRSLKQIASYPPLVFAGEARSLTASLDLSADELLQLYRLLDRLKSGLAAMD